MHRSRVLYTTYFRCFFLFAKWLSLCIFVFAFRLLLNERRTNTRKSWNKVLCSAAKRYMFVHQHVLVHNSLWFWWIHKVQISSRLHFYVTAFGSGPSRGYHSWKRGSFSPWRSGIFVYTPVRVGWPVVMPLIIYNTFSLQIMDHAAKQNKELRATEQQLLVF